MCVLAAVLLYARPQAAPDPVPPPRPLRGVADPPSLPVRLRIEALGVDAEVLALALDARGALEVPAFPDAMKVGWYALGPRPGTPGPAVFVGHRDAPAAARGAFRDAVFAGLGRLRPGDTVETLRGDGHRLRFRVTAVDTYRTASFPTEKVYGPARGAQLRLITCGGAVDRRTGHWDSNVVVSARLDQGAAGRERAASGAR
ncbi:class F sortase [Streptomyces sp. NPDC001941]|uniref:class F sortase n=1 Tax=Streptomyces sp. NPDC001941 TaxID=3154659 RepID=UPI0033281CA7